MDHIWAQKAFAHSLDLPYPLLADWSRDVARRYRVLNEAEGFATRSVFVIDRSGVVRYVNPRFNARKPEDYAEAFQRLEQLP